MDVSRHLFPWSLGLLHRAGWGLRLVLVSGLALIPRAASSGEWSSVFALSTTTSYEDNPTLAVDDETDNGQLLLRPSLTNRYEEARYRIDLDANATLSRSTDQSVEEDTVRYGFDVGGEYDRDTGTISVDLSLNLTTFTNAGAAFLPGALVGSLINADLSQRRQALIVANTATTVTVVGDFTGLVSNG